MGNYAFIDGTNLYMGIAELGWHLSTKKFRVYLKEKYNVETAYYFVGYTEEKADMYSSIERDGYTMVYRKSGLHLDGSTKGNVDTILVLRAIVELNKYDKAIIVTSDGDFDCLVEYLLSQGKFRRVLAPNWGKCSSLLKTASHGYISYLGELRSKLEYYKK